MPDLLEEDLRATAPRPSDEFVLRLADRVDSGFAKPPAPAKAPRFRFRPMLAAAVCVVLVAGFTATAVLTQTAEVTEMSEPLSVPAPDAESPAGSGAAPERLGSLRAEKRSAGIAPGEPRRREVSTRLDLTTPADEFSETTASVLRVADATGTIVASSNVSESNDSDVARYDLRVPTSRLDEVMRDLSELGDVDRRTEDVKDITSAFVSARDRLEDARDVRRALLRSLERAGSDRERSRIRARLRSVRLEISAAEAQVNRVRARTDRAKVAVTVRSTQEQSAWMPGDALDDAVRILQVLAGVLLVALAILAPLVLLALLGVGAARLTKRRRREAALG